MMVVALCVLLVMLAGVAQQKKAVVPARKVVQYFQMGALFPELHLTVGQTARIKAAQAAAQTAMHAWYKVHQAQIDMKRRALDAAQQAGNQAEIQRLQPQLNNLYTSLNTIRDRYEATLQAILTPEQRVTLSVERLSNQGDYWMILQQLQISPEQIDQVKALVRNYAIADARWQQAHGQEVQRPADWISCNRSKSTKRQTG
jgi:Spy/CpxP family protein refolding chaperone